MNALLRPLAVTTAVSAALLALATSASAQAPAAAPAQGGTDFTKIEVKTTKIAGNFSTLEGSGGMIGVLAGPDGVFIVDSLFPQLTDKIVAAIKKVSDGRIRLLVNTHIIRITGRRRELWQDRRDDHVARATARPPRRCGKNPTPPAAPADDHLQRAVTMHMNGDAIQLIPVTIAHTDGDTMVYFPKADVIMTGDFYRSVGYPFPRSNNGGTFKGLIDGLNQIIAVAKPSTKIIPGHGPDRRQERGRRTSGYGAGGPDQGRRAGQAGKKRRRNVAAKVTADSDAKVDPTGTSNERFVRALVAEAARNEVTETQGKEERRETSLLSSLLRGFV